MRNLHFFAAERTASRSLLPMDRGKLQAAGGRPRDGTWRSGTFLPSIRVAYRLHVCSFMTAHRTSGESRLIMTESADYIELHAASAFSFLDGASQPEALIERAIELEMPALALADRNGLYGAARFHTATKNCVSKAKIKAHIGAEIAVSSFGDKLQPPEWLPHQHPDEPSRITLLCTSQAGYQNLCQLITRFKMRESTKAEGAATLDDVEEFSAGLICLTGGDEGPLAAALAHEGHDGARKLADRLSSIFGRGNLFLELQRHQLREEECRNQSLLDLAAALHLQIGRAH